MLIINVPTSVLEFSAVFELSNEILEQPTTQIIPRSKNNLEIKFFTFPPVLSIKKSKPSAKKFPIFFIFADGFIKNKLNNYFTRIYLADNAGTFTVPLNDSPEIKSVPEAEKDFSLVL